VDRNGWALAEAGWNWRTLGLRGRTRRGDLEAALEETARWPRRDRAASAILLAWSLNELDDRRRAPLLPRLLSAAEAGTAVLVVEPLAMTAVPWWQSWADAFVGAGGRADEWKDDAGLP